MGEQVSRSGPGRTRLVGVAALGMLVAVALVVASARYREQERAPFGAYRGAFNRDGVAEFERWLGRDVGWALDFLANSDWSSISSPTAWAREWRDSPYRIVYSVPLIPASGGTLQEGANGAYNHHFATLARGLISHGEADAVLRLGWEFNGAWSPWMARDDPAAFVEYWRQVVRTMQSVPGAQFEFDWCPTAGPAAMPADLAYPGDEYVDYIGLDAYDVVSTPGLTDVERRWQELLEQPFGLRWHREFARAQDKPMSYPEWGVWLRGDGLGGGDNPHYVEQMHAWIEENDVAYHMYFDYDAPDGEHRLDGGRFPQAAAAFLRLFGDDSD